MCKDVTRYDPVIISDEACLCNAGMDESPHGHYVDYDDYMKLVKQIESLMGDSSNDDVIGIELDFLEALYN